MRGMDSFRAHLATVSSVAPTVRVGRSTGRRHPAGTLAATALVAVLVSVAAGCNTSATQPSPSPVATATPTPDPHLSEPATVKQIYAALLAAGLQVVPTTATTGGPRGEPRTRVNAAYDGWPLVMSEFSSSAALAASGFAPGAAPGAKASPYAMAGLNILIEFGPTTSGRPAAPPERFRASAQKLADVLDPLLGPLGQVAVVPVTLPQGTPTP